MTWKSQGKLREFSHPVESTDQKFNTYWQSKGSSNRKVSLICALLAIKYDAPGQKSPGEGGGGGTFDMLLLKPGYHHHLVNMFYTSSKIILNVTSVHLAMDLERQNPKR